MNRKISVILLSSLLLSGCYYLRKSSCFVFEDQPGLKATEFSSICGDTEMKGSKVPIAYELHRASYTATFVVENNWNPTLYFEVTEQSGDPLNIWWRNLGDGVQADMFSNPKVINGKAFRYSLAMAGDRSFLKKGSFVFIILRKDGSQIGVEAVNYDFRTASSWAFDGM